MKARSLVKANNARPAVARMLGIHRLLNDGKFPNCPKIAREFETSVRSVARDIEFMKDRLALPVEWDPRRNGYFYSKPVKEFPTMLMSESELFGLAMAHKTLAQYQGTPFEKPLVAALRHLTGQLDGEGLFGIEGTEEISFQGFAPDDVDRKCFEMIIEGMRVRRVLKFQYRNRGSTEWQEREVRPFHVGCRDYRWYLHGFDVGRGGVRTFALTRVKGVELGRGGYEIPKDFKLEEHLEGSFGVFRDEGAEEYEVVLLFDAFGADDVRGRRWHARQELEELADGQLRLRMRLNNLQEVVRWVRGFGEHVTVEGPSELKRRMAEMGKEDFRKYEG